MVLTVTDNQLPYARQVVETLRNVGVRVQADFRNEKLGFKIREAQLQKVPCMLVIGDKEVETATVTPRLRDGNNLAAMSTTDFIAYIAKQVENFH
jgi:threonyl-tRNA synthetase